MNNELLELIKTRRSCRKYTAEQVSDEQLAAVMEAGTYAPTAHGCQDPVIVAVQRTDIMQRIIKLNAEVRGSAGNPYYDGTHSAPRLRLGEQRQRLPGRLLRAAEHDARRPRHRPRLMLDKP